jgi:hypothetical protein
MAGLHLNPKVKKIRLSKNKQKSSYFLNELWLEAVP